MSNGENYIIENEVTDTTKKQEYWNTGIGLNKVDNLEPSTYLIDLSKKNINGELKYYEVVRKVEGDEYTPPGLRKSIRPFRVKHHV